jgi:hypothetical protein
LRPLLVVPGLFGTELHDAQLGRIWGGFGQLYGGPPFATLAGVRGQPGRVLRGIPLVLGLKYDLVGGLERALADAGYVTGDSLHFFAYDWRLRVLDIGARLAAEVRLLAADCGEEIDILGLSNGGPIIRAAYTADRTLPIERVITSGGPHAGTIETLACLHAGFRFAPFGRKVYPQDFVACPGGLDAIPSPDTARFLPDDAGYDLYDVATWRRLRLSVFQRNPDDPAWIDLLTKRLAAARAMWQTLAGAPAPRKLFCICGGGLPTQTHIVVKNGRPVIPGEGRLSGLPKAAIGNGDGALPLACAHAWTGAAPRVVEIPVGRHRDVVRARAAFNAIVSCLRA